MLDTDGTRSTFTMMVVLLGSDLVLVIVQFAGHVQSIEIVVIRRERKRCRTSLLPFDFDYE